MNRLPLIIPICFAAIYVVSLGVLVFDGNLFYLSSALSREQTIYSVTYSLFITITSTVLSLIVGTIIANLFCNSKYKLSKYILRLVLYVPHFLMAFFVYELLSGSDLIVSRFGTSIITAYVLKQSVFVAFYILPIMAKIKPQYYQAATLMGASKFMLFKTVVFPRLAYAYAEIVLILVSFIMSAYEIPYMLGNTYPKFIGVAIYNSFFQYSKDGKQEAIALMLLFSGIMIVCALILFVILRKNRINIEKSEGI